MLANKRIGYAGQIDNFEANEGVLTIIISEERFLVVKLKIFTHQFFNSVMF